MSASIELIAQSPESPDCESCGPRQEPVEPYGETEANGPVESRPTNGADVAVTLFLPGVGNGVLPSDRIDYTNPIDGIDHAEEFQQQLAAKLGAADPQAPCCRRILYRAHYDPFESAYDNAEELTEQLWARLESLAREPWIRKIHIHLLGFSAGGIVAINIAHEIEDEFECEIDTGDERTWCGAPLPREVPLSIDIVTMATPYGTRINGAIDPPILTWLAELFSKAGRALAGVLGPPLRSIGVKLYYEFLVSIGENDYGDEHPSCLCRFLAFVSSRAQGDDEAGDRDPSRDDRLRDEEDPEEDWSPVPIELAARLPQGTTYGHDEVPERVLADNTLGAALTPGCRCVTAP